MNLNDYQQSIQQFVRYAPTVERQYLALGLVSEIGELAGRFAKRLRGDSVTDTDVISELGDVLWFTRMIRARYRVDYVTTIKAIHIRHADDAVRHMFDSAVMVYNEMQRDSVTPIMLCLIEDCVEHLGKLHGAKTLEEVAEANYQKLSSRQARGVLLGNGDNR